MDTTQLLILVVAVVVLAVLAYLVVQRQRSEGLRKQFGPEYDQAVRQHGDARRAEAELAARQKRVEALNIRPLAPEERDRFAEAWRSTQAHFVDNPAAAITEADQLVNQVMQARGYPVGDFEQRAADISVDHPQVVTNYRAARAIAQANRAGKAGTEELRQALVHYRGLFEDLLRAEEPQPDRKEVVR